MEIIGVVFPVFFIVIIGYLSALSGFISSEDATSLGKYVFNIAIPALLFSALSTVALPDSFEWEYVVAYYGTSVLVFGIAVLSSRFLFRQSQEQQAIFGMGSSYSNTVLVGLPIISAGLGDAALLPLFVIVTFHTAVFFPIVISMVESDATVKKSQRGMLVELINGIALNPIVLGLVLGVVVNVLGIQLWPPFVDGIDTLGRAALPCALFALGATLNNYTLKGNLSKAAVMVFFKMIIHPAMVFVVVFGVLKLNLLWGTVAVMTAGMPTGVNTFVLSQRYDVNLPVVSSSILLSTIAAIFTQSAMLAVYLSLV